LAEFIFMLTRNDTTVANALEVYDEIRDTALRYVGFKDVGAPVETLTELTRRMHADGRTVFLEVVSESAEDELRSIRAARQIGVDFVMGGTHADEALPLLEGSGLRYYPFPGRIVGHPSLLRGTLDEIVDSAATLAARDGVDGLDLLAYRWDGDVPALVRGVLDAVDVPVVAAGSVDSIERIRDLSDIGVWGFTIGAACFDGRLPGEPSVRAQVETALAAAADAADAADAVTPG
jgi:hypothetical protein